MSARTVITHALNQGTHALPVGMRARYTGSQSWGPATVTVVKPWGGRIDPLYVVVPDGMDARFTYVVAESELSPVGGVSLGKATDGVPVARAERLCADVLRGCAHSAVMDDNGHQVACGEPWVRSAWTLRSNDLAGLADWFAASPGA